MIKLSKTWLNLSHVMRAWSEYGNGIEVLLVNGETLAFRGEDAQKIREALDFQSSESRMVMERVELDRPKPEETLRDLACFSKEFGPQEDGTLIVR